MTSSLTHINDKGDAHMVDVSNKNITTRTAQACANVHCSNDVFSALQSDTVPKGDVFATARIAGIQAAKKCSELIPLCHPLPLSKASIEIRLLESRVYIEATCKTDGKTGVEMEALTAASVAALTIYDMCKAIDKSMRIDGIELLAKTGGKSGNYYKQQEQSD